MNAKSGSGPYFRVPIELAIRPDVHSISSHVCESKITRVRALAVLHHCPTTGHHTLSDNSFAVPFRFFSTGAITGCGHGTLLQFVSQFKGRQPLLFLRLDLTSAAVLNHNFCSARLQDVLGAPRAVVLSCLPGQAPAGNSRGTSRQTALQLLRVVRGLFIS